MGALGLGAHGGAMTMGAGSLGANGRRGAGFGAGPVNRLFAPRGPQAGYPAANTLPSALGQQLGSLRGRGQVWDLQAMGSWRQVVKTTMTPDGCVLWEAGCSSCMACGLRCSLPSRRPKIAGSHGVQAAVELRLWLCALQRLRRLSARPWHAGHRGGDAERHACEHTGARPRPLAGWGRATRLAQA